MNNLKKLWEVLYLWRFHVMLIALIPLLTLPVFFSQETNDQIIWPLTRTLLLLGSLNLIRKMKRGLVLVGVLGLLSTSTGWLIDLQLGESQVGMAGLLLFGVFIGVVTYENFNQIRNAREVDSHVMVGAIDGFMLIGILGGLIYAFIHLVDPGSFQGVESGISGINDLFYFSYITVLTIGYGDIIPTTDTARRTAVFMGLIGQFYLVIIMAVLVGKYLLKTRTV